MSEVLEAQLETIARESAFLKKYFSLRKKCEQIQQANEKLVNRIQHVKKLIKRTKRERRYLASRLDEHGDNFREVQVPVMWEEDKVLYNILRPPPPYPSSGSEAEPNAVKGKALSSIQPLLQAHGMNDATAQSSSAGKSKKIKSEKDKDPLAPKKPANAFLLFKQQQKPVVQEEYFQEYKEDIAPHELMKRLAMKWNTLPSDKKKVYHSMYECDKERYDREMLEYSQEKQRTMDTETSEAGTAVDMAARLSIPMKQEVDS
ncbi:FACT complex subunit SSRP1-like [Gigantopelta aegis]|uniref:FACT complex subunit SSRP1-like n=1 Tax=Gigantopelta aegis TaxID=1735272 RepID=UPI001B888FAE|nr:FACT complex subunit SSRP1-like [Gigantopelta aegis]